MIEMDLSPASREPMRPPAPFKLLLGTLFAALLLNLLPWGGWLLKVRPDFLLLVLLYWATHESRRVGQGWAFAFGFIMDVADSVLLGQHALAYVAAVFLAQQLRLRLLQLSVLEQALHVAGILAVAQLVDVLLNLSIGRDFPGMLVALAPLLGAGMWPLLHVVAIQPRLRRREVVTLMH
ncbi:MAG TPA: rod shape-determining protein MreD [Usitatibacteraceae bacterium]|nr:rod shape-determining protein MreD [Usitatibacteraceae bacterium]